MQNIQDVWERMEKTKREQKNIRLLYRDALEASREYREVTEQLKTLGQKKKQIEAETKAELGSQYERLSKLKKEAELDREMLTDIAISTLMKGEPVKITDPEDNEYEPVFSVRFRKVNVVSQRVE